MKFIDIVKCPSKASSKISASVTSSPQTPVRCLEASDSVSHFFSLKSFEGFELIKDYTPSK